MAATIDAATLLSVAIRARHHGHVGCGTSQDIDRIFPDANHGTKKLEDLLVELRW